MDGWRSAAPLYQGQAAELCAISQTVAGIVKKGWISGRGEVDNKLTREETEVLRSERFKGPEMVLLTWRECQGN